ncbi:hypothetical protein BDR04DRAFT_1089546 [Suillus decipiens]|nr:hypothetical protein BDR04DRAFT_1089546 [Suillus decipiens]
MSAFAAATDSHDPLQNLVQDVFNEYITNEMPIHLLHITKDDKETSFQLVGRDFVREHFKNVPVAVYIYFSEEMLVDGEERENRIRERVKKELKYAIFSHRWSKQEALYHDILDQTMEIADDQEPVPDDQPGWKKLQRHFCCTAKDIHDCEFAWSDTCCINKKNSSELEESIRSMFRWYRNSHVCVAFLSGTADLAALQLQEKDQGDKKAVDTWFERGWTLQELLAPSQIKFYGSNWKPLIEGSTNDTKTAKSSWKRYQHSPAFI